MKNYVRMMLAVCAAVVLTAAAAAVEPPQEPYPTGVSGEAQWTLQGDTMYVTGQGLFSGVSNADSQPWEFFEEQIRHVVVADGVTLIGDNIFAHTYNLGGSIPQLLWAENREAAGQSADIGKFCVCLLRKAGVHRIARHTDCHG